MLKAFMKWGQEIRVLSLVVSGLCALGFMVFVLSPETFKKNQYKTYYTILPNAGGLLPKTQVWTQGVVVGKVLKVGLEELGTKVVFQVESSVLIPKGSEIFLREKGFLGDVFLEIVRFPSKESLDPADYIPPGERMGSLGELLGQGSEIAKNLQIITLRLAEALSSEDGQEVLTRFFKNMDLISSSLKNLLIENEDNLSQILKNLAKASKGMQELLNEKVSSDLSKMIHHFSSFSKKIDNDQTEKVLEDLSKILASVERLLKKVEKGEGTLGRLLKDEKMMDEIQGTIQNVRQILEPASRLKVRVDYHGEMLSKGTPHHYFNTIWRSRPDSFYLLGFADAGEETISGEKKIKINAQFAKRWGSLQLRFGLFETSGGMGSDVFLLRDKLKWTTEIFNWGTHSPGLAHFKSYFSFLFFQHVSLVLGFDDFTHQKFKEGAFLGLGLAFDDEDLKSIWSMAHLGR